MEMNVEIVRGAGNAFVNKAGEIDVVAVRVKKLDFHNVDAGRGYHAQGQAIASGLERIGIALEAWSAAAKGAGNTLLANARAVAEQDRINAAALPKGL